MIRISQPIISEDEIDALAVVLRSGMLIQGERVKQFEHALQAYTGASHVMAVSSGTAALHIAVMAAGIGAGDAVLVPAFTFPATANVVELTGARTIMVDVESGSYNMDPIKLEETIVGWSGKEALKAIIVVHEFGAPANMTAINDLAKRHGLLVIEDAACALGTRHKGEHAGTFGDFGCFSWHPRKAITTGEGGAITVKDEAYARTVQLLRNHGIDRNQDGKIDFLLPGLNYRLTEFQAVLGEKQLRHFDGWLKQREYWVGQYRKLLSQIPGINLPENLEGHTWQTFMIVLPDRADQASVIKRMKSANIETNIGANALHLLTYYKQKYGFQPEDFPVAKRLYEKGLAIPLHPLLREEDIRLITEALRQAIQDAG
ncbi:DegT/DnrJ/EryC1/StrS family aminotransferase [Brevibacillus migulae]|uniref:DegT/DnrJ/EryC1/StrS family aminotransferase n=1 Tax=Brevibacillus migulae TaxID=1644114 RepID=UPI00106E81A9|nr:DegT/DnrJ/EryC1/StrS family aminotransferase [Brevibacillus migulae]